MQSAQEFGRKSQLVTTIRADVSRRYSVQSLPILLPPRWLSSGPSPRCWTPSDDAIEGTEGVIAATEQLRDSLLQDLLTCGVPGWHTEWKEVQGLGTIPAGWEVVRLGDVAEVRNGMTPSRQRHMVDPD